MLTLDGNAGYGQVMGYEAMELGAERAKRNGVCVMGLSNAHHIGRIGHWAEQCIDHGLVSIHFVNVLARPIVAPFGGRDARHGTNPLCVGIPRPGKDPIVLDFATSKIAQGKTRVAYNKGEQLAPNTIIDDHGNPTTDPRFTVIEPSGAILPFGEHKGSGLALICELLGGALLGRQDPEQQGRRQPQGAQRHVFDFDRSRQNGHRREPRGRDGKLRRLAHRLAAGRRRRRCENRRRAGARMEKQRLAEGIRSTPPPGSRSSRPAPRSAWITRRSRSWRLSHATAVIARQNREACLRTR